MPYTRPTKEDILVLAEAVSLLDQTSSSQYLAKPMSSLFSKTIWMGNLSMDMLSRVPCDEVIDLAYAVIGKERSDKAANDNPLRKV